jgi:hypothetical protein
VYVTLSPFICSGDSHAGEPAINPVDVSDVASEALGYSKINNFWTRSAEMRILDRFYITMNNTISYELLSKPSSKPFARVKTNHLLHPVVHQGSRTLVFKSGPFMYSVAIQAKSSVMSESIIWQTNLLLILS